MKVHFFESVPFNLHHCGPHHIFVCLAARPILGQKQSSIPHHHQVCAGASKDGSTLSFLPNSFFFSSVTPLLSRSRYSRPCSLLTASLQVPVACSSALLALFITLR